MNGHSQEYFDSLTEEDWEAWEQAADQELAESHVRPARETLAAALRHELEALRSIGLRLGLLATSKPSPDVPF